MEKREVEKDKREDRMRGHSLLYQHILAFPHHLFFEELRRGNLERSLSFSSFYFSVFQRFILTKYWTVKNNIYYQNKSKQIKLPY